MLNWAESPIGCGLEALAKLTADIFGLEVPDFSQDGKQQAHGSSPPTSSKPGPAVSLADTEPSAYVETLNRNVRLDMVYVPGGTFWMGSPEKEVGRLDNEGPQHRVRVPAFYMGKYPVTQAQWYAASLLEPVQRELKPQPSRFTGDRTFELCATFDTDSSTHRLNAQDSNPDAERWQHPAGRHCFEFDVTVFPALGY